MNQKSSFLPKNYLFFPKSYLQQVIPRPGPEPKNYQKELRERDISIVFYNKGIAYLGNKIISNNFSKSVEKKIKDRKPSYSLILVGKDEIYTRGKNHKTK